MADSRDRLYRLETTAGLRTSRVGLLMQRVLGRFYSDWQVATHCIFCFLTLDRKPRLRSQSYIGPTIVGPDTSYLNGYSLQKGR